MKPISEMNLAECLEALHLYALNAETPYTEMHQLADRIHDLTRWIPVSERFPYEADAKGAEAIVWSNDGKYWQRITPPENKP